MVERDDNLQTPEPDGEPTPIPSQPAIESDPRPPDRPSPAAGADLPDVARDPQPPEPAVEAIAAPDGLPAVARDPQPPDDRDEDLRRQVEDLARELEELRQRVDESDQRDPGDASSAFHRLETTAWPSLHFGDRAVGHAGPDGQSVGFEPPYKHAFEMLSGGKEKVAGVIAANAAGGGKYDGKVLTGRSTAAAAGNLGMPEGLDAPAASDALVLNLDEDGLPTHWLKTGTYFEGVKVGMTEEATPRMIVVIPRGVARTASPSTLGSGAEGSETADTKEWQRDAVAAGDVYGDCPLEAWFVSRTVYNEAGDEILYQMMRKASFDAQGRLWKISAETRVTVDEPDDC